MTPRGIVRQAAGRADVEDVLERILRKGVTIDAWGQMSALDFGLQVSKPRWVLESTHVQLNYETGITRAAGSRSGAELSELAESALFPRKGKSRRRPA